MNKLSLLFVFLFAIINNLQAQIPAQELDALVEDALKKFNVAGAAVATGVGLKTAGLYVITNAVTGATMLGSTAAGASAAGTAGILSGTVGVVGTVGAALISPFLLIPAALVPAPHINVDDKAYISYVRFRANIASVCDTTVSSTAAFLDR